MTKIDTHFWEDKYPEAINPVLDHTKYETLIDVFESSCRQYSSKPAFTNMGHTITYAELEEKSAQFAAYLQLHTALKIGDRIAVQMPNILQYPVVFFGAMRAGMVVVNTNPLYTAREMEHQFNDAEVTVLVTVANFCDVVEQVLPRTKIKTVIITEIADMLPPFKRALLNGVIKYVKKMVPKYNIEGAYSFVDVMKLGSKTTFKKDYQSKTTDVALLQYTGGTTGVAKGAILTHSNVVANMLQVRAMMPELKSGEEIIITPLPLYHIFSITVNCMASVESGNLSVLITNPRDVPAFVKELKKWKFTMLTGLNTLFVALCKSPEFAEVDFSALKITVSGGMALQTTAANKWEEITGCKVCEGYGLTETSPIVTVNPLANIELGTIGLPAPETMLKVIDDDGNSLDAGERGELCIKGPQVMQGYWRCPEASKDTFTDDGWLKTGDVAVIQENGFVKIVDRKKDMILVSGFNVYPNELEDVVSSNAKVEECAAIGIPDDRSGEAVKMFIVRSDSSLTVEEIMDFCRQELTGYKIPKEIEFRDELPKTNVGKILRRELR